MGWFVLFHVNQFGIRQSDYDGSRFDNCVVRYWPDIFDIIRGTAPGASGEIQITDALQQQANEGGVIAYKFEGQRFDCGSVAGFVEATNHVYDNIYRP